MSRFPSPKSSPRISPPQLPPSPLSPILLNGGSESNSSSGGGPFRPSSLPPIIEHVQADHSQAPALTRARTTSISSISSKRVRAAMAASDGSQSPGSRSRRSSLGSRQDEVSARAPAKFQHHVSFDNFSSGKATEKNSISFTLNSKHSGYRCGRRSRTFMVGIDENEYSDIALKWMLEELVDDGDEIICLRVVEKDAKIISDKNLERRQYQKAAKAMMAKIQEKNEAHRAISIVLEFAVGELHSTFKQMMQLHEPAMLIVGTRGRSLGGLQGLMSNRNSFSKWCLQYSPIPVVVVRPPEKREKKKKKRDADPSRQDYVKMLNGADFADHDTELAAISTVFEIPNTPEIEAHRVNVALGLPVDFDAQFTPLALENGGEALNGHQFVGNRRAPHEGSQETLVEGYQPDSPAMTAQDSDSQSASDSNESDDEFETIDGRLLLENSDEERKKRLHAIELSEAAAFKGRAPKSFHEGQERGAEAARNEAARKVSVESMASAASVQEDGKRSSEEDEVDDDVLEGVNGPRKVSTGSTATWASDVSLRTGGGAGAGTRSDENISPRSTRETLVDRVDSSTSTSSSDAEAAKKAPHPPDDGSDDNISPGTATKNHFEAVGATTSPAPTPLPPHSEKK